MKKLIALLLILVVIAGAWFFWHGRRSVQPLPRLRAVMLDEDTPRSLEPSIAIQINEGEEATIFPDTPLWFTIGVSNPTATNEISAAKARSKRRPAQKQQSRSLAITIGDAGRPWTEAIVLAIPDGQGGLSRMQPLMPSAGTVSSPIELNSVKSAEALFGTASAHLVPGVYLIAASLDATGSWKGRVYSNPVKLTVVARPPQLSPEQENDLARQAGRFGLLIEDAQTLETAGRHMLATDNRSIQGHIYVGEAKYLQGKWSEALEQFTAARAEFARQHPNSLERPQALNARISQILEKL